MFEVFSRRRAALAVVPALAMTAFFLGPPSSAQVDGSGPRAVAHRAGGKIVRSVAIKDQAPTPQLFRVGRDTAEPTLGITQNGAIYYSAFQASNRVDVMRSVDGGWRWDAVSPQFVDGINSHLLSLDPYVWVDERTQRLFTIDLTVACSYLSFTDDIEGEWTTNPLACGRPVNDHQTLFGGPPVTSSPIGYDNLVYYCWNDVGTSSCSKSLDGGLTFAATGNPAFHPADDAAPGIGFCGGLHGHGVVGDDGTIYLPKEHCGEPWLSISKDEGLTWKHVRVSQGAALVGPDPSVDVDSEGNVYYVYLDADRLPYLVISRDDGKNWGVPKMLGAPGVTEAVHATVDAGKPGSVAVVYMGTDDVSGAIESRTYDDETEWHGYMTMTDNALDLNPVFYSASINDPSDPFARGACGPRRCYDAIDFLDVFISPDGIPYGAYADSCVGDCSGENGDPTHTSGVVGALLGGPRLR